jgi:hypothetical protein
LSPSKINFNVPFIAHHTFLTSSFHFDFDVVNWSAGKYSLKVKEWEQEPFVKTFEI